MSKALVQQKNKTYDTVIGTSTGALMGPFVLAEEFDQLEAAYTSVNQSDIFNVNPFKSDGEIKAIPAAWRVISGKKTLGESLPLRELVKRFFSVDLYNQLINSNKTYGASLVSLTTAKSEVKILKDNSYNDIIDWIWASANVPVFMSILSKDNELWTDGGLKDFAPIGYVLKNKLAEEIDVILHTTPETTDRNYRKVNGVFDLLLRTVDIFTSDVIQNDLENAKLQVQLQKEVNINFFFMNPSQVNLIGNNLVFDKTKMKQILNEGFQSVVDGTIIHSACKIRVDGQITPFGPN